MKKWMSIILLCSIFSFGLCQQVDATTPNENVLQSLQRIGVPADLYNQAQMYLQERTLSAQEASDIITNVDEVGSILSSKGIVNLNNVDKSTFDLIRVKIERAAKVVGLVITYDYSKHSVKVFDHEGKVVFELSEPIKNTGIDFTPIMILFSSIIVVIVGGSLYGYKKGLFVR